LTSKSLEGPLQLFGGSDDATIRVCGTDFSVSKCLLPFISQHLVEHFKRSNDAFVVSFDQATDASDSFFENVTTESLIESCSIFLKFFEEFEHQQISKSQLPSLILFSRKIFCNDLLNSLSHICSQNETDSHSDSDCCWIDFEPSNLFLGDNEFVFEIEHRIYKCSDFSASILSSKALKFLIEDNHHLLKI
jgi:hypothetical protein